MSSTGVAVQHIVYMTHYTYVATVSFYRNDAYIYCSNFGVRKNRGLFRVLHKTVFRTNVLGYTLRLTLVWDSNKLSRVAPKRLVISGNVFTLM